ncbi:MAG: PIN domain-containing protein [Acidimicrobiales bacterium]
MAGLAWAELRPSDPVRRTTCYTVFVFTVLTQRQLCNDSGEVMRRLEQGESFVLTRNGVPVGELALLRRHRFVKADVAVAMFRGALSVDLARLRAELDYVVTLHLRTTVLVPDLERAKRGIIHTSVVVDLERLDAGQLPIELAVSAITMAELAAGPRSTRDGDERARRQDRLQRAEAAFDPLPFDGEAARAYGRIYAAQKANGRKARGARAPDLLIAATACTLDLPIYTRDPDGFRGLEGLVDVITV